MRILFSTSAIFAAIGLVACGSSFPAPNDRLASTEAASRSALEVGADHNPTAQLYLKMANDQIEQAKAAMKDGDNEKADLILQRANSDAELSLSLAKEASARAAADEAIAKVKAMRGGK